MTIENTLDRIATALEAIAAANGQIAPAAAVVADGKKSAAKTPKAVDTPTTAAASAAPDVKEEKLEAKALDYEKDVKPVFNRFCNVKGIEAAQAFLKQRGYQKKLTEAKPDEYAEIVAQLSALIEG